MGGRHCDVQVAIVVVVENRNPAPGTGLIQANLCGNIFELHRRLCKPRLHLYAEFLRHVIRIAAQFLSAQPEHQLNALIRGVCRHRGHTHFGGARIAPGAVKTHARFMQRARPVLRAFRNFHQFHFGFFIQPALHQRAAQFQPGGMVVRRGLQPLLTPVNHVFILQTHEYLEFREHLKEIDSEPLYPARSHHFKRGQTPQCRLHKQRTERQRHLRRQPDVPRVVQIHVAK